LGDHPADGGVAGEPSRRLIRDRAEPVQLRRIRALLEQKSWQIDDHGDMRGGPAGLRQLSLVEARGASSSLT
jgi:hypothetical protein